MEPADVRRIAFVTRRFHELQGLRRMGGALYFAMLAWLSLKQGPGFRTWWGLLWFAWMILVPGFIAAAADRFYAERTGRVSKTVSWRTTLIYVAAVAPFMFDVRYGGSGRPSTAALLLGGIVLAGVFRDWPWRLYRMVDVLGCVIASAFWAHSPLTENALLATVTIMCTGAFITGYLDHRFLTRTLMPYAPVVDPAESEAPDGC